jgi:tripartite-type tricarboxylate transporter receptor subunit TctC
VRTVQEFVALAKREPGKLNFASAGAGSSNHLLGEIFLAATGAPVVHVPYKGAVMARDAVIRGEAQLMDEVTSPLIGALRAGQLVPLFMTGERRDPAFPDIPTAAEAGLPEMTIQGFFGLLAPAGTPGEIVARLNGAMRAALVSEPVARTFGNLGFTTVYSTPEQMAARIAEGRATYDRIVKARQIRVD